MWICLNTKQKMINFYLGISIPNSVWYEVQSSKQTRWHIIDLGRCQIHLLLKSRWRGTWQGWVLLPSAVLLPDTLLLRCQLHSRAQPWHFSTGCVFWFLLSIRGRVKSLLAQEGHTRFWNAINISLHLLFFVLFFRNWLNKPSNKGLLFLCVILWMSNS